MNYELQLFDDSSGQYVPVETGDNPSDLMDLAIGMARRVVSLLRGTDDCYGRAHRKSLPLKPRILHGMSGKPRRYHKDTIIEPPNIDALSERVMEHYESLANIDHELTIHLWQDSLLNHFIRCRFGNYPNVTLAYIDNETGEPVTV